MNSEIIAALIGGGFALICVAVGNLSARKTAKSQEQMRLLAEFYAEVFSTYASAIPFTDDEKAMAFISAVEKTKLFCSEKSENLLATLEETIANSPSDAEACRDLIHKLRKSAKEDLRKR